jgi:uncharacterized protein (TIGR02001 family)
MVSSFLFYDIIHDKLKNGGHMKKKVKLYAILPALILLMGTPLISAVEVQADMYSRYIWRGFDLNPDNKPVLQPGLTWDIGESGFSVNLWMSFSFSDRELNETDITLSYDRELSDTFSVSAGLIHYGWYFTRGFRFSRDTSHEIYVSATRSCRFMDTSVSFYYDFDKGEGLYVELLGEKSVKLNERTGLDLSVSVGYNAGQWIEGSGFSDINFSVSMPYQAGELTISPTAAVAMILMDEVNDAASEFWLGLSLIF